MALGVVLRQGPGGALLLMSEVPLQRASGTGGGARFFRVESLSTRCTLFTPCSFIDSLVFTHPPSLERGAEGGGEWLHASEVPLHFTRVPC